MNKLAAFALLVLGHCATGFLAFLILVFAGAASAGAESYRTHVLPIGIGIDVFLIVISVVQFFRNKFPSALAAAWAVPALIMVLPMIFSDLGRIGKAFGYH
jgi:hypothetical protein